MARSRCSTETYSSLSRLASSSARDQDLLQPLGEVDLARLDARAGDLGPARQLALDLGLERLGGRLHAGEQAGHEPLGLLQEGEEKVLAVDLLVAIAKRFGLGALERLLGFLGQLVDIHSVIPSCLPLILGCRTALLPPLGSLRSEPDSLRELLGELALAVGELFGDDDPDLRQQVPLAAAGLREPAPPQPDLAARRRSPPGCFTRTGPVGVSTSASPPSAATAGGTGHGGEDVRALDPVARVGRDLDLQEEIARRSAAEPRPNPGRPGGSSGPDLTPSGILIVSVLRWPVFGSAMAISREPPRTASSTERLIEASASPPPWGTPPKPAPPKPAGPPRCRPRPRSRRASRRSR